MSSSQTKALRLTAIATISALALASAAVAQNASQPPAAPVAPAKPAAPAVPVAPAAPVAPVKPVATPTAAHGSTPEGQGIPAGGVAGPSHPSTSPLKFEVSSHDFGKISDSKSVSYEFKFKNTSDKVVNIVNATGSCGCTVPTFEKQHQPGGEGKITATFNPAGRNGREVKTVTVYLDDPATPTLQLQIIADVQKRVIVEPMQVYMGEVNFKTSRDQTVTLTGRAENFDITNAEVQGSGFKLSPVSKDKVEVSGEQLNRVSYKVTVDDTMPISRAQANAVFSTNDPLSPTVNVSLIADVVGQLRINPPQIGIKMSVAGEPFFSDVFIENREAQPFNILGVSFEPAAGLSAETNLSAVIDVTRREPGSKAAYRIRLSGTTPANATELRGIIKVQTDAKDQADIAIQVSGFQVPVAGQQAPKPTAAAPQPNMRVTAPQPVQASPAAPAQISPATDNDVVPGTVRPEPGTPAAPAIKK